MLESPFVGDVSFPAVFTDVNVVPEQKKKELEHAVSTLEVELEELRSKQIFLDKKRRETLNKILDIKGSVRVFCRLRPFLSTDRQKKPLNIHNESEKIIIRLLGAKKGFTFDKVFSQEAKQEDVFAEVKPILRSVLDGHNVCIFSYGQTGTGKTFTMEGTREKPGIVPRAMEEIFRQVSGDDSVAISLSMSMLEVYMGCIKDLLSPRSLSRLTNPSHKCALNVQMGSNGSVEIEKLTSVNISNCEQSILWYAKGKRVRSTSWTNVNEASSRSHCLTRITIIRSDLMGNKTQVSKLWMVDLGGSERLLKTGAKGLTLDEGRAINLSLSALGDVISALKRKQTHVPYRNSKFTQILRDSLGEGSKAVMLVHISPNDDDIGETICSLNFAKRARGIDSEKDHSEEAMQQKAKKIAELEEKMKDEEDEYQKVKNNIVKTLSLLKEKKNLISVTYPNNLDQTDEVCPTDSPEIEYKRERKNLSNSIPRFMSSTVSSRQRQNSVGEIGERTKNSRSRIEINGSMSLGYIDSSFKRNSQGFGSRSMIIQSKKSQGMFNSVLLEPPSSNHPDLKSSATVQKKVSSPNPNMRVGVCGHRRRLSSFN